jgi:hypothetical protein
MNSKYRDALSSLHTTLVDSRNGYEEAIKDAGETGLVTLFEEMVALRRQAIAELEPLVAAAGLNPDEDGSFMSTVHRTVISVQSMLTDLDETVLPGFIDVRSVSSAIMTKPSQRLAIQTGRCFFASEPIFWIASARWNEGGRRRLEARSNGICRRPRHPPTDTACREASQRPSPRRGSPHPCSPRMRSVRLE